MIDSNKIKELQDLYNEIMLDIMDVKDIKIWSSRKTYSSTMEESERANETKVMDAIAGSNYVEGDRFYVHYRSDDTLALVENFNGDYNRTRLLKNLYDTISIFDGVLPVKDLFINYSLKRNAKYLPNYVEPIIVIKPKKPKLKANETQEAYQIRMEDYNAKMKELGL